MMVVHCRAIERQFSERALRPASGESIEFPVIDTMELEARLHVKQASGSWLGCSAGSSYR